MSPKDKALTQIIDVSLRGSVYKIACHEGEGHRLVELADRLNARIDAAVPSSTRSKTADIHLLLLVGLQLEDRIEELENDLKAVENNLADLNKMYEQAVQEKGYLKELLVHSISKTDELTSMIKNKDRT